jgi:hypothetical protein
MVINIGFTGVFHQVLGWWTTNRLIINCVKFYKLVFPAPCLITEKWIQLNAIPILHLGIILKNDKINMVSTIAGLANAHIQLITLAKKVEFVGLKTNFLETKTNHNWYFWQI